MTGHIFISYARDEKAYVQKLAAFLAEKDLPTWFDHEIELGTRWTDTIERKINSCAAFVVLMSPASRTSRWVDREINQAELRRRPILPLLRSGEAFFRLSDLQIEQVIHGQMPSLEFVSRLDEEVKNYHPFIRLTYCRNCHEQYYPDDPSHCSYHPGKASMSGNIGPRDNYRDVWRYACCGQRIITAVDDTGHDMAPPRSPGCVLGSHVAGREG